MTKLYLLAGNGSASDWWDDVTPHFQHYQPIPIELPGFGSNTSPPCDRLAAYAESLFEATEAGHAILALHISKQQPKALSRIAKAVDFA